MGERERERERERDRAKKIELEHQLVTLFPGGKKRKMNALQIHEQTFSLFGVLK